MGIEILSSTRDLREIGKSDKKTLRRLSLQEEVPVNSSRAVVPDEGLGLSDGSEAEDMMTLKT
jgi:hypothetical protein